MRLINQTRLDFLLEFVEPATILADIGTDHGYVPIEAIKSKQVSHAYGADLNFNPLNQARKNVEKAGLSAEIDLIQTDGLTYFKEHNIRLDYVVIAGLGAQSISKIIAQDYLGINNYLICANTDPWPIREQLQLKNLLINQEFFLVDQDQKYWFLWVSRISGRKVVSKRDLYLGVDKHLLNDRDYQEFLALTTAKYKKLLPLVHHQKQKQFYELFINMVEKGENHGSTENN